jgi:hypothetical protein
MGPASLYRPARFDRSVRPYRPCVASYTIALFTILLLIAPGLSSAKSVSSSKTPMQVGRIWVNLDADGAEGRQSFLQYPGGLPISGTDEPQLSSDIGWVSQSSQAGTYLFVTDWTDPFNFFWKDVCSYKHQFHNDACLTEYTAYNNADDRFAYLFPISIQEYQRWDRPVVTVETESVGAARVQQEDNCSPEPLSVLIDPGLTAERVVESVWRYIPGVELRRKVYSYPLGSPHQDYVLMDIALKNTGIIGGYGSIPEISDETVTGVLWAQALNYWNGTVSNESQRGDGDAMYIEPWGAGNHSAVMLFDGDDAGTPLSNPGPDWGDPSEDPRFDGHLLDNAYVLVGPVFVSTGPVEGHDIDDSNQPAFRLITRPGGIDLAGEDYSPTDSYNQRQFLANGSLQMPIGVSFRDLPVTADIVEEGNGPTAVLGYGPVNAPMDPVGVSQQGWALGHGEEVRIVQMVAAGGIGREEGQWIGRAWNARRVGGLPPSDWMSDVEIRLVQSGRDTAMKAAALAWWNYHGEMPPYVTPSTLESWGLPQHLPYKLPGQDDPYDVPDAPRPPATVSVAPCLDGGIEIVWSRESENEPDQDTRVHDFAGYRIWKQAQWRGSAWKLVAEGPEAAFEVDTSGVSTALRYVDDEFADGVLYWYSVTAYDDGTQNWSDAGRSLESSRWSTWTGFDPGGVQGFVPKVDPPPLGTIVFGVINTQTWNKASSPYRVVGPISVPPGNTLTIEAGTEILFDESVAFVVNGRINAVGAIDDSITFAPGASTWWGGLRILPGSIANRLSYVSITGGRATLGGGLLVGPDTATQNIETLLTSSLEMDHSVISGNTATLVGGGVYISGKSNAVFSRTSIRNNQVDFSSGGLFATLGAKVVLDHCLVAENEAQVWAPGVKIDLSAHAVIIHSTIVNNIAPEPYSAGLNFYRASGVVANSIIWRRGDKDALSLGFDSDVSITYSDVQRKKSDGVYPENGNLNTDPSFVDADAGDYRLSDRSPCLDTGDPKMPYDDDGTRADMGAFATYRPQTSVTLVSGTIGTATWTESGSPYWIASDVVVADTAILTIESGVNVIFDAPVSFTVHGALRTLGTARDSIRFIPADTKHWRGLRFIRSDSSSMTYTRISGVRTHNLEGDGGLGGAIMLMGDNSGPARLSLDHVVISHNTADRGAGIYSEAGDLTMSRCTLYDNEAIGSSRSTTPLRYESGFGGAIYGGTERLNRVPSRAHIDYCTISGNTATGNDIATGLGIPAPGAVTWYDSISVNNTILWGNKAPENITEASQASFFYSIVDVADDFTGTGHIDVDPLFVAPENGNFKLLPGSPAIDAGNPYDALDADRSRADIGAWPTNRDDSGSGPTSVIGTITTTTWTRTQSPYVVLGPVNVPNGAVLTIEPGVDVLFDIDVPFIVEGSVRAMGVAGDSIRFLPYKEDGTHKWGGIRIISDVASTFNWVRVSGGHAVGGGQYPDNMGGGLFVQGSRVEMSHSVICGNRATDGGGVSLLGAVARFDQCVISDNMNSFGGMFISGNSDVLIDRCTVARNDGWAIYILGADVEVANSIVWSEADTAISAFFGGMPGALNIHHSCVRGGALGVGNFDTDPMFVDASRGVYLLQPQSACVDAGEVNRFDDDGTALDVGALPLGIAPPLGERVLLPNIEASPGDTVEISISARTGATDAMDLAFVIDRDILVPLTRGFLRSHAFSDDQGGEAVANMHHDTVFVSMYGSAGRSFHDDTLVTLAFRLLPNTSYGQAFPLRWLPAPRTVFNERPVTLVSGSVHVLDVLYGDASGDGAVSMYDASLVLRWRVRLATHINHAAADVTGNGETTSQDAAYIMRRVLDPLYLFPVESDTNKQQLRRPRQITWYREGQAWVLGVDKPDGVESADVSLRVDDALITEVTGEAPLEYNTEGGIMRIALVRATGPETKLMTISGPGRRTSPPEIVSIRLNEGEILIHGDVRTMRFSLAQNSPNPFNPSTVIRFSLEEPSMARVVVYDLNGRVVRKLVQSEMSANEHQVRWDGEDENGLRVGSGVYICRISAVQNGRQRSLVRRMVLLR